MISERQGPTRSEQTNQILTLCQGALDGRESDDAVRAALDARERQLQEARQQFAAEVAAEVEGMPAPPSWEPFAQAVLVGFEEYSAALNEVRGALRGKGAALEAAMRALTLATERLFIATDGYEARLVSEGESRHDMHNFLSNMTAAARRGDLEKAAYAEILEKGRLNFEKCMAEMRNAPEGEPAEAVAALLAAFGQCRDAIVEMAKYLDDGSEAHCEQGLAWLEQGLSAMTDGFAMHRQQKYAAGPTSSTVANTFISAAQLVKAGQYPVETFEENVAGLREHLVRMRREFEGICQASTTSVAIQEEIPRAMEAFDLHEEALEAYARYLEHRNPADLDEGNARLIEAMKRFDEAKATFEAVSDREGKIVCPRCGALNDGTHRVCGQCNASLPWMAGDGPSTSFNIGEEGEVNPAAQDYVLTDNMRRVIEDTNRVAAGEITGAQYAATLDWMTKMVAAGEAELDATRNLVVDQFAEEDREKALMEKGLIDETKAMLREGLQALRGSLDEMRHYITDGDEEHLRQGIKQFWDASQQVYQVQRIGELAARSAQEAAAAEAEAAAVGGDSAVEASPADRS